jgi:hypothetical protein
MYSKIKLIVNNWFYPNKHIVSVPKIVAGKKNIYENFKISFILFSPKNLFLFPVSIILDDFSRVDVCEFSSSESKISATFSCRTIRIGSYKFESKEQVSVTSKGIRIIAPSVKNMKELTVLNIQHSEIIKFVMHFTKQLQIIFIYTKPSCAKYIVNSLQMSQINDKCELTIVQLMIESNTN